MQKNKKAEVSAERERTGETKPLFRRVLLPIKRRVKGDTWGGKGERANRGRGGGDIGSSMEAKNGINPLREKRLEKKQNYY